MPELLDALARISYAVLGRLAEHGAAAELSLTQVRMLAILRDRTPRMADLAAALGLDRSSVTGLVTRAEQRGLVVRTPAADDGRSSLVGLTASGAELAASVGSQMSAWLADRTAGLTESERATLTGLLERLLD